MRTFVASNYARKMYDPNEPSRGGGEETYRFGETIFVELVNPTKDRNPRNRRRFFIGSPRPTPVPFFGRK